MQTLKLTKKYEKYPEYKDSGVAWLNNLPTAWKSVALRSVLYERREKNKDLVTDNILSVMKDVGVIRYEDKGDVGNKSSDNPSNYKIVYPNDIVVNSMNLKIGSVGISKELGVTSSIYIIYRKSGENVLPHFYNYVFMSKAFQKYVGRLGKGIMEIREAIKPIDLKSEVVPLPPVSEQAKIIKYLDQKTVAIDQIIEKKKRLLEVLKEKRTSVITNLVNNSYGEKGKLKNYIQLNPSKKMVSVTSLEDKVSFVPMEAISELGKLELQERNYKDVSSGFTYFADGDVVLAKITPCYENGKAGVMKGLKNGFGFGTTEFMVMRPSNKILADYLYYVVFSDKFRKMGEVEMRGTAGQKRVSSSFVMNYELYIPDIKTQQRIVDELNKKMKMFDVVMEEIEKSTLLLKEFKISLVSNVITGNVRV